MVNQGRASRCCLPCRRRKLRCDLRPEGCSQCYRAKLKCHGYRDSHELNFRDETRSTEQKVLSRRWTGHPRTLQPGWDVRSRYAFFSTYVFALSRSCDTLAPIYAQASAMDHLSASVDAVSLAFMSFQFNSEALVRLAREKYVIAIQKLWLALRNPQLLTTDITLQAVLVLDLYEKMVNRNPQKPESWMSHVQGAMSLVTVRGNSIFSNYITCQLAYRLVVTLTISCGAATLPVPNTLIGLQQGLDSYFDDAKWGFIAILTEIVNLQASLCNGRMRLACSRDIVEKAWEIDNLLATFEARLPLHWKPRRVFCTGYDPRLFAHYYDIYPNHYATQLWNAIRVMRLAMADIVRKHGFEDASGTGKSVLKSISEITLQICAAVPQFILPDAQPDNILPLSPLQSLQCNTLLAPLYLAAQVSMDQSMRDWIIRSMQYMAEAGNIKMAQDVAHILSTNPTMNYWAVYAMTGSYAFAA